MTQSKTKNNQITGNIGLYYCCYHLSRMGWNVMPTVRNTRGADLIVYSQDTTRFHSIQVKTVSARSAIGLGGFKHVPCDYWIIVAKVATEPLAYIMLSTEVKEQARPQSDGKQWWLEIRDYENGAFEGAWDRMAMGTESDKTKAFRSFLLNRDQGFRGAGSVGFGRGAATWIFFASAKN